LTTEKWKQIKRFKSYEVSSLGRVRRTQSADNNHTPKTLQPRNNGRGYLYVALYQDGKRTNKAVHILVATAFLANPLHLPEVNHLGPKGDNREHRLEWRSKLGHKQDQAKRGQKGEGVTFRKDTNKWQARYSPTPSSRKSLGFFATKREAKDARDEAVAELPRVI
jgi:hypothetical protein